MNTSEKFVITISRELGSGGRTVGRKLAEALGVRYSDKELVHELMKRFNLTVSGIEKLKGEKKTWISDFLQMVAPVPKMSLLTGYDDKYVAEFRPDVSSADIFKAESEILQAIAAEESCEWFLANNSNLMPRLRLSTRVSAMCFTESTIAESGSIFNWIWLNCTQLYCRGRESL